MAENDSLVPPSHLIEEEELNPSLIFQPNKSFSSKKILFFTLLFLCIVAVVTSVVILSSGRNSNPVDSPIAKKVDSKPFNVIFILADGFSPAAATMSRISLTNRTTHQTSINGSLYTYYTCAPHPLGLIDQGLMSADTKSLSYDSFLYGTARTYSSSSWVTDSAAGATAYATGKKTYNTAIAVDDDKKWLGTMLEAAAAAKYKTGIVVTSRLTHATPAAFSSHVTWRELEDDIALQQVKLNDQLGKALGTEFTVDLLFGGGRDHFLPTPAGSRVDGQNLIEMAQGNGFEYLGSKQDLENWNPSNLPVLGLFSPDHIPYVIDRTPQDVSLSQMVSKAIQALENNEKGYFLMIEASRIDHLLHVHDAGGAIQEVWEHSDVFQLVSDLVQDTNTLVISVADHATGGLTLGDHYDFDPNKLTRHVISVEKYVSFLINDTTIVSAVDIEFNAASYFGFTNYSLVANTTDWADSLEKIRNETKSTIIASLTKHLVVSIGDALCGEALCSFSTVGHTGVDINIYCINSDGKCDQFRGSNENTLIGRKLHSLLGLDLDAVTTALSSISNDYPEHFPTGSFAGSKKKDFYHSD